MFIVAKQDALISEQLIVEAYNEAAEPKKRAYIDGYHFSPYLEQLQAASKLAMAWFRANL